MAKRTFNKPSTKVDVKPAIDIRTVNYNNLPGSTPEAWASRGDQFTPYESSSESFEEPTNQRELARSDRFGNIGAGAVSGDGSSAYDATDESKQKEADRQVLDDLENTGKDLAVAGGNVGGGTWTDTTGTGGYDYNPFGTNTEGQAPTQEFLISTKGKTGVFSQNPKKITLTDQQAMEVYEDYKKTGQGRIRIAPSDGRNLNYAEVATWLNPTFGVDKFGPKKMELPQKDVKGQIVRDEVGMAVGSGVYDVRWPETSYEAELAQGVSDKKQSKDSSHPPPARFGKEKPWFTVFPDAIDYNRVGQMPMTDSFGNIKWISDADFKDKGNIMSTSGYSSMADFTKTFYKTDAKGNKYKTSGQKEHEKAMKYNADGSIRKGWSDSQEKQVSNFLKWGGKKPVHYAEGDFEKRKAIMGIGDYGKGGSKGWTGLTYQAHNRDFNLMKKNMMNEIRGLQGPGSKSRAIGIIKKYKDTAANTGMQKDFAEIAARWEKNFGLNKKAPTGAKSSNTGYQNISLGSPMTWQDAKKQSMGMI